jgi:hypothetical protein
MRVTQTTAWHKAKNDRIIKPCQTRAAAEAYWYAGESGMTLKVFITIRWFDTIETEINIQSRFQRLMRGLQGLYRRRGSDIAYIATHENPYSGKRGPAFNTHILVNLPSGFSAKNWFFTVRNYIERKLQATSPRSVDIRAGNSVAAQYMLKGCAYGDAWRMGMLNDGRRWKHDQGHIHFPRITISQNINFAARLGVNKRYPQ